MRIAQFAGLMPDWNLIQSATNVSANPDTPNPPGLEFVDAAAAIANSLPDRDDILLAVAANYATLGLLDDAIRCADEIADSYLRDTAIANIAANTVASEPDADPLSLIESIDDPGVQSLAREQLAIKYAEHNLFDEALEICRGLDNSDSAFTRIVPIIGEKDSLARGGELVEEISDSNARTVCLIELAKVAKATNQSSQGSDFLLAAAAEVESYEPVQDRVDEMIAIADVYRELSQGERAKEILGRAFQLCKQIEGSRNMLGRSFVRDEALVQLAGACASCGEYAQADLATEQIENPFQFGRATTKQAVEHHQAGHDTQALELLAQAGEVITSEGWSGPAGLQLRDDSLADLALGYAAVAHYQQALETRLLISSLEQQLTVLIEAGKQAALAGMSESMLKIYEAVDSDYARASFLVTVSEALRQTDKTELALRLLLMAIKPANKIERADQKCLTWIKIASRLSTSDLASKAGEIFSNVLNTTVEIKDAQQQAGILLAMAEAYQQQARELGSQEKELVEKIVSLAT